MERNYDKTEAERRFQKLRTELFYCYGDENSEDFDKFKKVIEDFELERAPELGLFPENDKYWDTKALLFTSYFASRMYKDVIERKKFAEKLLTTHGYSINSIKEITDTLYGEKLREELQRRLCSESLEMKTRKI
jgi:hypothetical protein